MSAELSAIEKRQLLIKLLAERDAPKAKTYPLSHGQKALWFMQQLFPENAAFNETFAWRITGRPDTSKLRTTAQKLSQHHATLRTTYQLQNGLPVAVVHPSLDVDFDAIDATQWSDSQLHAAMHAEANQPIDLEHGPVFRLKVYRRQHEQIWLTTVHHIAIDLWSMMIIMEDLRHLLIAGLIGQSTNLPPTTPYEDFSRWQSTFLSTPEAQRQRQYWLDQVADVTPLQFPTDRPHPKLQTFRGNAITFTLDHATTQQVDQLSKLHKTTRFTTLLSLFEALIARYSQQSRFLIGSITSGRTQPSFERTVGFLANPVPLRVDCSDDPTFAQFLDRNRQTVLGALANQDYPFSLLIEQLGQERDLSRPPLANIAFILQNPQNAKRDLQDTASFQSFDAANPTSSGVRPTLSGMPIDIYVMDQQHAKFDLRLEMLEAGGQLTGILRYNIALFNHDTIERLVQSFQHLVHATLANPQTRLSQLPCLSPSQSNQILHSFNATNSPLPSPRLVHQIIQDHALQSPDAPALEWNQQSLSYTQLSHLIDTVTLQLTAHSTPITQTDALTQSNATTPSTADIQMSPDVGHAIAAIYMPRHPLAIATIIASWKAGLASLPLDLSYPPARLLGMLQDARPSLILTDHQHAPQLQSLLATWNDQTVPPPHLLICEPPTTLPSQADSHHLASSLPTNAHSPLPCPTPTRTPQDPAYIVYTSGSTGSPKGAILPHAALQNLLFAQSQLLNIAPHDRVFQFSNLCFDASLSEILQALGNGATLILPNSHQQLVGEDLGSQLAHSQASIVTLPPSILATLPHSPLPKLHTLLVAGEPCSQHLIQLWSTGRKMFNAYGPSEAGVCATMHRCQPQDPSPTLIGKPIPNVQVLLLDPHHQPVPIGVPGELFLAGPGVGLGYLRRPDLTAERFVTCSLPGLPPLRTYRTGDSAKFHPDGTLEFLGRSDQQVKCRGYRIELGEISATLLQSGLLDHATVLKRHDREQLIAFVLPHSLSPNLESTLRQHCQNTLPGYMIPTDFCFISHWPIGLNGKLDHQQLLTEYARQRATLHPPTSHTPDPSSPSANQSSQHRPPRSPLEHDLTLVFQQTLERSPISIDQNFFDLGGHSLLAAQLAAALKQKLQRPVPLYLIFAHPTIEGLAHALNQPTPFDPLRFIDPERTQSLRTDSLLDSSFQFPSSPTKPSSQPRHLLLTGATGFLGIHLLHELLQQTDAVIHCLVRADSISDGLHRIHQRLTQLQLPLPTNPARIVPEIGDLALPHLGLTPEHFHALASSLDAIYHNGAMVNFVLPYPQLKPANVEGTKNVLRLAALHHTKPVHYISTLSVFPLLDTAGSTHFSEDDLPDQPEWLWDGYAQSKWVAERLMLEAHHRGLPITLYRPGRITGHSQIGRSDPGDLLHTMLEQCIQLQKVPAIETPIDLTPVDYVSQAIVALSHDPAMLGRSFHLKNSQSLPFSKLIDWLRAQGHQLAPIPLLDWKRAAQSPDAATGFQSLLAMAPDELLTLDPESPHLPTVHYYSTATEIALNGHAISCPPIDDRLLALYFQQRSASHSSHFAVHS